MECDFVFFSLFHNAGHKKTFLFLQQKSHDTSLIDSYALECLTGEYYLMWLILFLYVPYYEI